MGGSLRTQTRRRLDAYTGAWLAMYTEACEATTVRGEQSPEVMDLRMRCLDRAAVELRATVDQLADADDEVVQKADALTSSLRPLSRCADLDALMSDEEPPPPAEAAAVDEVLARIAEANARERAGRYVAAKAAIDRARSSIAQVSYEPVRAELMLVEGRVLERLGDYEAAEASLSEALELAARGRQWRVMQAAATRLMFVVGYYRQRMDEALRYQGTAGGLAGGHPSREAEFANVLGGILYAQSEYEEAAEEFSRAVELGSRALGPDHPEVAKSLNNLANVHWSQGDFEQAELVQRRALDSWERRLGPEHPDVARARYNLALGASARGEYEEAEEELRRASKIFESSIGSDHPETARVHSTLAFVLMAQGEHEEAEAGFREALTVQEAKLGPQHPEVGASRGNLGLALRGQGKFELAVVELRRAVEVLDDALGSDHPDVATTKNNLALVLADAGMYEDAEKLHRSVLATRRRLLDAEHPHIADTQGDLAALLLELRRPDEALPLSQAAWDRLRRDDVPKENAAKAAFALARSLWATNDDLDVRERVRSLAQRAATSYSEAGVAHIAAEREVRAWIRDHFEPLDEDSPVRR